MLHEFIYYQNLIVLKFIIDNLLERTNFLSERWPSDSVWIKWFDKSWYGIYLYFVESLCNSFLFPFEVLKFLSTFCWKLFEVWAIFISFLSRFCYHLQYLVMLERLYLINSTGTLFVLALLFFLWIKRLGSQVLLITDLCRSVS